MTKYAWLFVALAACGTTTDNLPSVLDLNRPIDVSFACYGSLRLTGGGRAGTVADPVNLGTAVSLDDCDGFSMAGDSTTSEPIVTIPVPVGQEDLTAADCPTDGSTCNKVKPAVSYYAFILQSAPGTVAVAHMNAVPPDKITAADLGLVDVDKQTPGPNGITIGDLPVGIRPDRSGCFQLTANAGTCDLSTLDVNSAIDAINDTAPAIASANRGEVTNGAGPPVRARPAALVAEPTSAPVGVACPSAPSGMLYVAYPDCHIVAAIDSATGQIQSAVQFDAAGVATVIPGSAVSCPAQCGAGDPIAPGTRPISVDLTYDARVGTRRLAIGAENSNRVTVVDLDAAYLPTSTVLQITLEGAIGVTRVALSPQIGMGGGGGPLPQGSDDGLSDGGATAGQFQFVYAVATDGTVRVADVLDEKVECDTEIDARYLIGVTDSHYLSCMPVGDPRNKPRRAGAVGPGIQFIGQTRALAVTFFHMLGTPTEDLKPSPLLLYGYFAMVSTTNGAVYVINVDDDNYYDSDPNDPTAPLAQWVALALPHQIRDHLPGREQLDETSVINPDTMKSEEKPICYGAGPAPDSTTSTNNFDGPRIYSPNTPDKSVGQTIQTGQIPVSKAAALPSIHQVMCVGYDAPAGIPVSEMWFGAPSDVRKATFPDLRAINNDETWSLTWEGALSADNIQEFINGPVIRSGQAIVDGTGMRVAEGTHPYCGMGVEPHDEVILRGCDPTATGQCGLDEICYVHPEGGIGSCLPTDQAEGLSGACRDFLVSLRNYAVTSVRSDELRLIGRRHVLRTTPITGCTSTDQCATLETVANRLPDVAEPGVDDAKLPPHTWSCEADPSRPGPNQCVMTCGTSADCDLIDANGHHTLSGAVCDGGRCVEGVIPPLECLPGEQRYQVLADRAFTVIGSRTGYVHPIIADPTGVCVRDPNANPLQIGRIPLTAPPCLGNGLTDLSPNPCSLTVQQTEYEPNYKAGSDKCELDTPATKIVTRDAAAIRFRNAAMTYELVDPTYPGDAACIGDRGGSLVDIPVVYPGYLLSMRVVSGFLPLFLPLNGTVYPINVVRGPLESIWIADEGDFLSAMVASTKGQVFIGEGFAPATVNVLQ